VLLDSITKTVSIDAPVAKVFAFVADARNWPKWAIVNVKSIVPGDAEWWRMETPVGSAKLRIRPVFEYGILDHDFDAPDASWTVPARVVPNGSGCEFLITFYRPPHFTKEFFEEQITLVDKELAQLKALMETA
jgi:uncharacterized protein YndB with AHSA1/START domain